MSPVQLCSEAIVNSQFFLVSSNPRAAASEEHHQLSLPRNALI